MWPFLLIADPCPGYVVSALITKGAEQMNGSYTNDGEGNKDNYRSPPQ